MKVLVEKVGKRIYLRTKYSPDGVESCKKLGGRWSKTAKSWTFPLDLEMARKLREEFPDLDIGEELWAWAAAERTRERNLGIAGAVKDMDVMAAIELPNVQRFAPFMWEAMTNRPYQPVASLYCATARQSLLADQPGLGKTIESLGALVEAGKHGPVLILAPKTSCSAVWEPEIHKWMKDYKRCYTVTNLAGSTPKQLEEKLEQYWEWNDDEPDALHFLIVNAEMARVQHKGLTCPDDTCDGYQDWCPNIENHKGVKVERHPWLFWDEGPRGGKIKRRWSALLADETHKWLINTRGKNASQVGFGFAHLHTMEDNFRIAITGTPLKGKKLNLFGTLNWLRPDVYTSKWRWAGSYFQKDIDDWTGKEKVIGVLDDDNKDAFFRSLRSIMIRRTKAELRAVNPKWMPPEKLYHDVWVSMMPKQRAAYRAMELAGRADIEGGQLSAQGTLAIFTRLKQFAGSLGYMDGDTFHPSLPSAKFDWLVEFLSERGIDEKKELSDDVMKVVVASQFTQQINVWAAELVGMGIQCYVLTGETKAKDRKRMVDNFQAKDNVRVFFINTNAGGVSITLDAADDMVIMDETWVPDEQEQVEDRVHRASNITHQVDVWYVRTKETIEERIADTNIDKGKSNHLVLDAHRGLAFARSIKKGKKDGQEARRAR